MPPWFQTYTSKQYFYLNPTPEMICIEDIAHSLASQTRFIGHTREPYSVGQHSVLASRWVDTGGCSQEERTKLEVLTLLHDASEAYLGDVPSPLKALLPEYKVLEELSMRAISARFGLRYEDFSDLRIKHVDMQMLATEKRDLCGPEPAPWLPMPEPLSIRVLPWPTYVVEDEFLMLFKRLGGT